MLHQLDTRAIFTPIFIHWRVLGIIHWPFQRHLRLVYDILLNTVVTVCFPLHLIVGIIFSTNQEEFFTNLVMGIASVSCVSKHLFYRYRIPEMQRINEVLAQLDDRVRINEDYDYYKRLIERPCNFMVNCFTRCYFAVSIMGLITALVTGELIYPAFIPLQWRTSVFKYALSLSFQFIGVTLLAVQNIANDAYGPVLLCMLSGHVHLLSNRVSRVGHDKPDSVDDNYKELSLCIEDHKLLMSTTTAVGRTISASYLVQFGGVGINLCTALVYLLFFADNYIAYVYYSIQITAMLIELFPCCYYGSMLECEFHDLSYAIFSCNWPSQPRPFRRNIVNFTELTLREVALYAGGMVRINLDSFFSTLKTGYSFFTVIQTMK
ncbi:odorant receptor 33b-like [Zeugodacus cucurbitae]|uniref:odorant receptor 33b-like n=1 Tax=Zeugodacus cucurbitae TaxID=28588 RepID=UPI0023D92399|nr:odorant receptor 33b-like [Zeugodacus cucurbitae]